MLVSARSVGLPGCLGTLLAQQSAASVTVSLQFDEDCADSISDHRMLRRASAQYFQILLETVGGVDGCWACTVSNTLSLQQFAHTDLS